MNVVLSREQAVVVYSKVISRQLVGRRQIRGDSVARGVEVTFSTVLLNVTEREESF